MEVNILVEGDTEEIFVKEVLKHFFEPKGIYVSPTIINTKVVRDGKNFKGGLTNGTYGKFINDLDRLIHSTPHGLVTTFIDYYALPSKFPKYTDRLNFKSPIDKVVFLEEELKKAIGNPPNFLPFIQLHEFETFLFVNEVGFQNYVPDVTGNDVRKLCSIIENYPNPEDINEGRTTAPSKRIEKSHPSYEKKVEAIMMVMEIGMDDILEKCPHFRDWVESIVDFADAS